MEIIGMSFSRIALIVAVLAVPCNAHAFFGGSCGSWGGGSCGSNGGWSHGSNGSHGSCGGFFSGLFSGSHGSCGSYGGHGSCGSCGGCHQSCGCEQKSCGCEEKSCGCEQKSDCGCSSCGGEVKSEGCGCNGSQEATSGESKMEPAPAAPSTKNEQKAAEKMEKNSAPVEKNSKK
jgi:hypothetical protein